MRALLSVYDKTGLIEFAEGLEHLNFELLASGGTSQALRDAGIAHLEVAEVTGAPEMLDGRVKTLHPKIHGGILADRSKPSHLADLSREQIEPIDIVVCNLYPFSSNPSIELIDVGGPTMVRAAAKNHAHVAVIVDPIDYSTVLHELEAEGQISDATRRRLATDAFAHTAAYDAAIRDWFRNDEPGTSAEQFPERIHLELERRETLRYGENPHQHGARYWHVGDPSVWERVEQFGGLPCSYLNLLDAEAALNLCHEVTDIEPGLVSAVVVKHANPSGVAVGHDLGDVYTRAFAADPLSAFGGVVAISGVVDEGLATLIFANPQADVIIATGYDEAALAVFATKRKNMRILQADRPVRSARSIREIDGGFLVQDRDEFLATRESWTVPTRLKPNESQWIDIDLAWRVCARTTSNAIVLAKDGQVVGVGCGQQSRVDAAGIAARKADGRAIGGVGASDAFFPFRDGIDAIADAGVAVIIQPGGSIRDADMIATADEREIAMVMTGERHFRH